VVVAEGGLTFRAVVEVLANSTFVTDSHDGRCATAITFNPGVFNKWLFGLFVDVLVDFLWLSKVRILHKFIKDAWDGILKLLPDEVLNGFARHVGCTALALALFSFSFFLAKAIADGLLIVQFELRLNLGLTFLLFL